MPESLLELKDVVVRYGGIEAVKGISLNVVDGEVVTLIGGNGAGKTTTLKTISGVKRLADGAVFFRGERIDELRPDEIVALGICQAPEGRHIFLRMNVRENLAMGAYGRRDHKGVLEDYERVYGLFPVLKERERQPGGTLSGGEQQMLAIGRALMSRPRLLMLDEPSLGLAPMMVQRVMELIARLADRDRGILLVEQLARVALQVAHRGYLLEAGRVVLSGTSADLQANDRVREIYMGVRKDQPGIS